VTADEPTDPSLSELVEFARELLGGRLAAGSLAEPDVLLQTITEAPELWLTLYRIHHEPPKPPEAPPRKRRRPGSSKG
jgi:hypothetical protein